MKKKLKILINKSFNWKNNYNKLLKNMQIKVVMERVKKIQ